MKRWYINADVGEGYDDGLIMPYLDDANIACGAHAGDASVMAKALKLAKQYGVRVGAHPGYPDREHFGRESLALSAKALRSTLNEQMSRLIALADAEGLSVYYVKPHGALSHDMLTSVDIFRWLCEEIANIGKPTVITVPINAGSSAQSAVAEALGLSVCWEVFADRAYEPSGLLRARQHDDALHKSPDTIIAQINSIYKSATISAIDGQCIDVSQASTICVHGDHPPSIQALRQWAS